MNKEKVTQNAKLFPEAKPNESNATQFPKAKWKVQMKSFSQR
jgi:hypothetical protein